LHIVTITFSINFIGIKINSYIHPQIYFTEIFGLGTCSGCIDITVSVMSMQYMETVRGPRIAHVLFLSLNQKHFTLKMVV